MNIELGHINTLTIVREVDFGLYLDGGDDGEILLPNNAVPADVEPGDSIEVFLYKDSEDRLIATTETPFAMVGDIALLEVVAVNRFGAFLDWGLAKDLMVPFREQKRKMEEGMSYLVFVYIDGATERIVASAKIDSFLDNIPPEYKEGEGVSAIVYHQTDLGYKLIINKTHTAMLYKNNIFKPIKVGDELTAYIKKIREDDKIDVVLQQEGMGGVAAVEAAILDKLNIENGFIALTDKSSPEIIYDNFGVSKKIFKKAIGGLYKKQIISLSEEGIHLR